MSDLGWNSHIQNVEDANYSACIETAKASGLTASQAENCDDGSLGCGGCPWAKGAGVAVVHNEGKIMLHLD